MNKNKIAYILIALVSILGITGVVIQNPIAQNPTYHLFSDQRFLFGIPNFWNVTSNLPFLLVGLFGLYQISYSQSINIIAEIKAAYLLFFFGVSLVSIGSGYYHIWPDNASLVWDRLPMTIAFMALFPIILSEFISVRLGKLLLWPLMLVGIFSVFYWQYTESLGVGDLRLYILVQFLPMLIIPITLLLFKSSYSHVKGFWFLLLAYVLAKFLEFFDEAIFNVFVVSGHSLKHIVAALGVFYLLNVFSQRDQIRVNG